MKHTTAVIADWILARPTAKLVNKQLMLAYAKLAAITPELGLTNNLFWRLLDRITILWSLIILITNLIKLGSVSEDLHYTNASYRQPISHLITLNYLPMITSFGRLYYGLHSISVGSPLIWRLYLAFYRPSLDRRARETVRSRRQLARFYMDGPSSTPSHEAQIDADNRAPIDGTPSQSRTENHWLNGLERLQQARLAISHLEAESNHLRHRAPLSQVYTKTSTQNSLGHPGKPEAATNRTDVYSIPTLYDAYLVCTSDGDRWRFLLMNVIAFQVFIILFATPVLYLTQVALAKVMHQFSLKPRWPNDTLAHSLYVYGCLEQVYAVSQGATLFAFPNFYMVLFQAELQYHSRRCINQLTTLKRNLELGIPQRRDQVLRQQVNLWAYFDYIGQFDSFVSSFAVISVASLIIGLSFGQSYFKVDDPALKSGTSAVLLANFVSFTLLYIISWYLELSSGRIYNILMAILAREPDHIIRYTWHKLLTAFYDWDGRRTFTMASKYPLNLHTYSRTIFGLSTISLVINRLFHKRNWEHLAPTTAFVNEINLNVSRS